MEKKNKRSVKVIAYGIIGIVLLLMLSLAGEFFLRLNPKYGRTGFEFDQHLIWRQTRGFVAQKPYAMGKEGKPPFTIRFNEQGFRGKDFKLKKEDGVKRIMILGDSYGAGLDYPDDEIFTQQLEDKLNADGTSKYEILNISSPAWATDQQYLYWTTEGKNYKPDILLLVASPNDLREAYNKKLIRLESDGRLQINQPWFPRQERIGWKLSNKSSLFQWFQTKILKKNYGDFFKIFHTYPINYGIRDSTDWDAPAYLAEPFKEVHESYFLFEKLLQETATECKTEQVKLLVTKVPVKVEYDGSYKAPEFNPQLMTNMLDSLVRAQQIPFYNMNQKLEETENPLSIFFSWEYHFNKNGHDFFADQLYQFIKANE